MPANVFANDLHKPSIRVDEADQNDAELAPPDSGAIPSPRQGYHMVMEIDEESGAGSGHAPDSHEPYLECLLRGTLPPDKTDA